MEGYKLNEERLIEDALTVYSFNYDKYFEFIEIENDIDAITLEVCVIRNNTVYYNEVIHTTENLITKKNNLFYDRSSGKYYYIVGDKSTLQVFNGICNRRNQPIRYLTFNLDYSANNLLKQFDRHTVKKRTVNDKFQGCLDYTFGIEYETSFGVIPEKKCYESGLIPLRDGSIGGFEYTTIVLGKTYGLSLVKRQLELLKKYTTFDDNCSMHIHLGKLPYNTPRFIYTLYKVCKKIEPVIEKFYPRDVFDSAKYKESGKNYCMRLPEKSSFIELYNYFIDNPDYYCYNENEVNLNAPHPNDLNRNRKWNIHSRYHWVNFINLMFYGSHKTVEFRFLRPTTNFNNIKGALVLFTTIINCAKKYYELFKDSDNFYEKINALYIDMNELVDIVYSTPLYPELRQYMNALKSKKTCQEHIGDYFGKDDRFDFIHDKLLYDEF